MQIWFYCCDIKQVVWGWNNVCKLKCREEKSCNFVAQNYSRFFVYILKYKWLNSSLRRASKVCLVVACSPSEWCWGKWDFLGQFWMMFWTDFCVGFRFLVLGNLNGWIDVWKRDSIMCLRCLGENENGWKVVDFYEEKCTCVNNTSSKRLSIRVRELVQI